MAEEEKPLTREDVLRLIQENGGKAYGLDLSGKQFEIDIDLHQLDLEGIVLEGARLWRVHLEGAKLKGAQLGGADLRLAHLEKTDLIEAHLEEANLYDAHLEGARLWHVHLEGACLQIAHLEGAHLRNAHLEGADLFEVELSSDTRLENVHWGNYILKDETKGYFDVAVHSYRRLKQWYTNAVMPDIAAKFYYREKEANRKSLKWYSRHRIALELLRVLFGYGEDWKRVFYWMALVVLGSAIAYYLGGGFDAPYSLYFSVISFTALGYGKWADITPQGWVQALGAFESFTGLFLMALLLVTFFRKWTR